MLDIGAGQCWSTRIFAQKGANATALDIVEDKYIGLGAAEIMMQKDKTYFSRVFGSAEKLPFSPASYDIIFFTGALHHTNNLLVALTEAHRVLKKEGMLVLTNEACGGLLSNELIGRPNDMGINEHNYKYARYKYYLKKLGFKTTNFPEASFFNTRSRSLRVVYELRRYLRGGVMILIAKK